MLRDVSRQSPRSRRQSPDSESRIPNPEMPLKRPLALFALLAIVPVAAQGQTIPSSYEYIETRHSIGIFGGYLETDEGRLDLGPKPSPFGGIRYDLNLAGPLYGGIDVGVSPTTRTVYARTANVPNPPLAALGDANAVILMAEPFLRLQITGPRTWKGFAPYVLAFGGFATNLTPGTGREDVITDDQYFRFGPAFAAGAGLGTDFYVTERLSLRLDFRDKLWRLALPVGLTGSAERESEWTHNFALTLGSAIHF